MRKISFLICLLFGFLVVVSSCGRASYKFMHSKDEIMNIEIVEVEENTPDITQTVVSNIEDIDGFIQDFLNVDCFLIATDPRGISKNCVAIKIIYSNGDYELIHASGQAEYTNETGFKNYVGYRYFDEAQFEQLISNYS